MKVIIALCLVAHVALAAKGPVAEPVCDAVCPDTFPIEENWHIPYTGDCGKFCHCANDGNWKKDCPAGLHFNPTLQVCDWPASAGCVEGSVPGDSNEGESSNEEPTDTPVDIPDGCEDRTCGADDCFVWSNSGSCQAYCDCDHGEIILKECSDGLQFNPETGDCDWPENVGCVDPTPPPTGCEHVVCEGDDCFKAPNTIDCNKYCDCDHGNVTIDACSEGLHFNPATGACDFPWNANCEKPTEKPAEPTEEPAEPTEEPTDAPVEPTEEPAESTEAPVEPTEDPIISEETTEESSEAPANPNGECDNICPNVWPIVDNNHLPIPGVCTQFCHCANDGNWLKDCPPGLHFNAEKQVCDWPQDAGCVAA